MENFIEIHMIETAGHNFGHTKNTYVQQEFGCIFV
jgi:hypothetical protein